MCRLGIHLPGRLLLSFHKWRNWGLGSLLYLPKVSDVATQYLQSKIRIVFFPAALYYSLKNSVSLHFDRTVWWGEIGSVLSVLFLLVWFWTGCLFPHCKMKVVEFIGAVMRLKWGSFNLYKAMYMFIWKLKVLCL